MIAQARTTQILETGAPAEPEPKKWPRVVRLVVGVSLALLVWGGVIGLGIMIL